MLLAHKFLDKNIDMKEYARTGCSWEASWRRGREAGGRRGRWAVNTWAMLLQSFSTHFQAASSRFLGA